MGHWENRWIQTPQRILMDPCIKQAPVLSKRFWIIPWPLAYNRLELDCIRKIINFWYTFGWKWRVFVTIYDCRTHVCMTSMTSSVERTDLNFKISVALLWVMSLAISGLFFSLPAFATAFLHVQNASAWRQKKLRHVCTLRLKSCNKSSDFASSTLILTPKEKSPVCIWPQRKILSFASSTSTSTLTQK